MFWPKWLLYPKSEHSVGEMNYGQSELTSFSSIHDSFGKTRVALYAGENDVVQFAHNSFPACYARVFAI